VSLIALSIIVQLALVVHIIKTGRNTTWVFIVLFFPLIGTLAYFIIELLPELTNTRTARTAHRKLATAVDPDKALREASARYAQAQTVQSAMDLASEHLLRANYSEAKDIYQRALSGVHDDDPDLLMGLAQAHFGLADYAAVITCLDTLKEKNPAKTSQDGHLLYARALEATGRIEDAIHEYETLVGYYAGPEPSCRLGELLKARGRQAEARVLFEAVLARSQTAGKHYNVIYKEWVAQARRETQS
jgi:hypothetical protein